MVVHGDLTCYQVFFFELITISVRNSVKAGIIRTSEAHSCSVPTTGISIASLLDLSSLANRGIPSAFLMACLFFVLLLQLQFTSGLVYIVAILFTRVKVLRAYTCKVYVTAEIHPKVVVHGGLTCVLF